MERNVILALEAVAERYQELAEQLEREEIIRQPQLYSKLRKEHSSLRETVDTYHEYLKCQQTVSESFELINNESDPELIALAQEELHNAQSRLAPLEERLKILLLPQDEDDERDVIIEIRGAAGGEEANLFAGDLYRIYQRWCDINRWEHRLLDAIYSENGGYTQVIFSVSGPGIVYGYLKYEAGVHRVQRVPATESIGRVHTSTVTVVVLPDVPIDDQVSIHPDELRVDTYRSSGAGGQSVNTTDSAVRITHLPTGIVVTCQEGRSQIANKELAIRILHARLVALKRQEAAESESNYRRQGGSGARAEKIRTYNWSQDRVTDHRVNISLSLRHVLEGRLTQIIDALVAQDQRDKMAASPIFHPLAE